MSVELHSKNKWRSVTYPGNVEELLGKINNTRQLLDVVNTRLDGVGVVGTGSVQDVRVLLDLALGPLLIRGATIFGDSCEDAEDTEQDNGLLVEHIEFVADGGNGKTGSGGESGGLRNKAVAGDRVKDRLSLLLRVFAGDVGVHTDRGEGTSDGREVAGGKHRPQPGGTC